MVEKEAKLKGDGTLNPSPSAASVTKQAKSPDTVHFYCKADSHWNGNASEYLIDKGMSGS